MCFKKLFGRQSGFGQIPVYRPAVTRPSPAPPHAHAALSVPPDKRPLSEQIRAFIHALENPPDAAVRYSERGTQPAGEVWYRLPDQSASSDEQYSLPHRWNREIEAWIDKQAPRETFREHILRLLEEEGLSPVDFYTAADIDRKLFSRMKLERDYRPSKDTAVRCCLALKLDIGQTEETLSLAGYSLSWSLHEDLAVRWCIQHRVYRVYDVMEVVEELRATQPV